MRLRQFLGITRYSSSMKILIAEDDRAVRQSLERVLDFEGYEIVVAEDGPEALEAVKRHEPDLVLLDVMMPHMDGLDVCRRMRSKGIATPVLMLTAKQEISDRVSGLDAGADDYLAKPYALDELLARIRALLRRGQPTGDADELSYGDLSLNMATRIVQRAGERIDLTKTEFDLLELFMMNPEIVLERDTIYDRIWGFDFETSSNSLDVYIGYLRRKTESNGAPRIVHTVRGVGYSLRSR